MAIKRHSRWSVSPDPALRQPNHVSNLFHTAIESNDVTQAKILLKYENVKLETRNILGQTALHRCCDNGSVELVRLLLEHGAELETRDPRGWTAMHYAASNDHYDVVRFLLAHCASVSAKSCEGLLPLDYATHERVRRLLCLIKIENGLSPERTCSSSSSGVCTEDEEDPISTNDQISRTLPRNFATRQSTPSKIPRALMRQGQKMKEPNSNKMMDDGHLEGLNLTLRRRPKKCSADSSYGRYLTPADRRSVHEVETRGGRDASDGTSSISGRSSSCETPQISPRSPVAGIKRTQSTKIPTNRDITAAKEPRINGIANWMRNSFGKRSTTSREQKKHSLPVTRQEYNQHEALHTDNETHEQQQHHRKIKDGKSSLSLRKRLRLLSIRRATSDSNIPGEDAFLSPKVRRTAGGRELNTTT